MTDKALILLLFLSVCIPFKFSIGAELSPIRIYMLIFLIPFGLRWISGQLGGIHAADIWMMLFAIWILISLMVNHGLSRLPYAAISMIETFGGYIVGRALVRNRADFIFLIKILLLVLLLLTPFIVVEVITSKPVLIDLVKMTLGSSYADVNHDRRFGLWRAQVVFDHPIMFGLFASLAIANAYFIWHHSRIQSVVRTAFAFGVTFMALSSGPLLAAAAQIGLILWGKVTKNRWWLLVWLVLGGMLFLQVASNRGPFIIVIETLTFNSGTGWTRVIQFIHGSAEVMRNPIFGIGLHDWQRPGWLSPSVDNFWLLSAMRYGLVGFVLLVTAFTLHIRAIVKAKNLPRHTALLRQGYLIGLISAFLTMATVHVWGTTSIFLMTYIGAGAWFYCGVVPLEDNTPADQATRHPSPMGVALQRRPLQPTSSAGRNPNGAPVYSRTRSVRTPRPDHVLARPPSPKRRS